MQSGGQGPNPLKHKITGTFGNMARAQQDSILGLSRTWKKTQGVSGAADELVYKLALSMSLNEMLEPVVKPTEGQGEFDASDKNRQET